MTDFDKPGVTEQRNPFGKHTERFYRAPHQYPMRCPACSNLNAEYIWSLEGRCALCGYEPRRKKTVRDMAIESWQVNTVLHNRDPDVRAGFPGPEGWTKKHLDILQDTRGGMGPSILEPDLTPRPLDSLKTGSVAKNLMEWTVGEDRARARKQRLAKRQAKLAPLKSSVPTMVHKGVQGRQIA